MTKKYSSRNDQDLREVLRIFVSKNNLKFTVFIETLQRLAQIGLSAQSASFTVLIVKQRIQQWQCSQFFHVAVLSHCRNRLKSNDRVKILLRQHPINLLSIEATKLI